MLLRLVNRSCLRGFPRSLTVPALLSKKTSRGFEASHEYLSRGTSTSTLACPVREEITLHQDAS